MLPHFVALCLQIINAQQIDNSAIPHILRFYHVLDFVVVVVVVVV